MWFSWLCSVFDTTRVSHMKIRNPYIKQTSLNSYDGYWSIRHLQEMIHFEYDWIIVEVNSLDFAKRLMVHVFNFRKCKWNNCISFQSTNSYISFQLSFYVHSRKCLFLSGYTQSILIIVYTVSNVGSYI